MKTVKEYVEDLNRVCRERDLRITPQRVEVFKAIVKSTEHPSAEETLKKVRRKIPHISHDTVYRTLSWLVSNSLIYQVGVVNGVARYDGNLNFHFHCICDSCGVVADVFPDDSSCVDFSALLPNNFSLRNVLIEFRGCCKNCKN